MVIRYEGTEAVAPACARCCQHHGRALRAGNRRRRLALVTDGRFSGGTRGSLRRPCFGPEAAVGGPIALLRNGDRIVMDAVAGTIDMLVPDEELAARRAAWVPRKTDYNSGAIWKYAQLVGPAHLGAVTNPGGAAETHCYADL